MASRGLSAQRRGDAAERAVAAWLRDATGMPVGRARAGARLDSGDMSGLPGVVVEVKSQGKLLLLQWLRDLVDKRSSTAGCRLALLAAKPRGVTDPEQWYWLVPGDMVPALILAAVNREGCTCLPRQDRLSM